MSQAKLKKTEQKLNETISQILFYTIVKKTAVGHIENRF